uniref:RING-type E3 ubiquitin transferase n=1 Tax=Albugo laibachii Nc14 TaxID=890382 RepID=F0W7R8_9STRA|nr:conserved hypothetical protein [Albugo laibachii Nc14]|eukprot:CCA17170.1 conserved hypothetical protein [Albugo laibachii Nc14]
MSCSAQAEKLKKKGNECFQREKYHAAIEFYTKAMSFDEKQTIYYTNRALCYSKLQDWSACLSDCKQALVHDAMNPKPAYLLGLCRIKMNRYKEAVESFSSALILAERSHKPKEFQNEIFVQLLRAKKKNWEENKNAAMEKHRDLKSKFYKFVQHQSLRQSENSIESDNQNEIDLITAYVEHMAISLEVMQDPVITPSGISYERSQIELHIHKNGPVEPITRQKLTTDMLRPNNGLRDAIRGYLHAHPWAFES